MSFLSFFLSFNFVVSYDIWMDFFNSFLMIYLAHILNYNPTANSENIIQT